MKEKTFYFCKNCKLYILYCTEERSSVQTHCLLCSSNISLLKIYCDEGNVFFFKSLNENIRVLEYDYFDIFYTVNDQQ